MFSVRVGRLLKAFTYPSNSACSCTATTMRWGGSTMGAGGQAVLLTTLSAMLSVFTVCTCSLACLHSGSLCICCKRPPKDGRGAAAAQLQMLQYSPTHRAHNAPAILCPQASACAAAHMICTRSVHVVGEDTTHALYHACGACCQAAHVQYHPNRTRPKQDMGGTLHHATPRALHLLNNHYHPYSLACWETTSSAGHYARIFHAEDEQ